jgi:hypothetical protein
MRLTREEVEQLAGCRYADHVTDLLKHYGFEYLDGGHFSTVFKRGCVVVKLGHNEIYQDGGRLYAKWLYEYQPVNPAFPRVYTYLESPGALVWWIAEMERLAPVPSNFGRYTDPHLNSLVTAMKAILWGDKYPEDEILTVPEFEASIQAAALIRARWPDVGTDLHHANWMLRGEQPVLTDPISYIPAS